MSSFLAPVLMAGICGAALGLEREMKRKPAGLRTNMLIAVGSASFMWLSRALAAEGGDPGRIAAQIVTGIGFLGAGAIVRHGKDTVTGLTTAATVWMVAAVGMLCGSGHYGQALMGTLIALALLVGSGRVEDRLHTRLSRETEDPSFSPAPARARSSCSKSDPATTQGS